VTLHVTPQLGTVGEDADDLRDYLHGLAGCPPIHHTQVLRCSGTDESTWFYVESDAEASVARRRCVGCGRTTHLLDSEAHWTHPPMHACAGCGTSIVELAIGLHTVDATEPGQPARVRWLAMASRCVECGRIDGLTDAYVPDLTVGALAVAV
jgi:hypothetical protein